MLENDYIMRTILFYVRFLRQALQQKNQDPRQTANDIEQKIGEAISIDPGLFFSLTPESMATMLKLGDYSEALAEYMLRAIALSAEYHSLAGEYGLAELRRSQASGLITALPVQLSIEELNREAINEFIALHDEADEE